MTWVCDFLGLSDIAANEIPIEFVVSVDPELRFIALEGRV